MATANTALRVTELDFDSIKNNIKNYLRSQSEFEDFDFEGSGMSVLLDILAYNTHYMGYYLNMTANEMFLDTAQLRASVLSHAKMIGYIPRSREGAVTQLNIQVTPSNTEDQTINLLTLDRYTRFLGDDINGQNYGFVTLYANTAAKTDGVFNFSNVIVKQGDVATYQYSMQPSNAKRSFVIPSANVDITTLTVTVQESSSNTDTQEYFIAEDITEVRGDTPVYFLEENAESTYTISFGDDIIGKRPKNGSIITCKVLDTVGSKSNNISRFILSQPIGGIFNDNVSISVIEATYGGTDKETIEQIRFRAPYFYTTQNRAVTNQDYATLITKDYNNIDAVSVWGGEENDPPVYGKVYLSLKTKNNFFLSNLEKENIKEELIRSRNVLTVTPEIVDPDYTYLLIRGTVTYNPSLTSLTASQLPAYIRAAILDYEELELNTFTSTFRKSKLQQYIENSEKSITGSDIKVFLQKRIAINPDITQKYTVTANFPIKKGDFNNKISSFPQLNVYDSNRVIRPVYFEEVPSAFTGIDSIEIVNPGINFTTAPTITITGDGTGAVATATVSGGRISTVTVVNPGQNYTRAVITVSGNGTEASLVAKLQTKVGLLRTYYTKANGEKVIVNDNAGSIDYESGTLIINPTRITGTVENDFYVENVLTFMLPIDGEIIPPLRNRIITIDQNDPKSVQFEVSADQ